MSERSIRRRIPPNCQKTRPPKPSRSPRLQTPVSNRSKPPKRKTKNLQRCNSEPILWTFGAIFDDLNYSWKSDAQLFRPQTCTDVFMSPLTSPSNYETYYKKDAKVVVNVTVEGSPGPVRTLVRLGASVEETIKLVVDKYGEEGRSPRLDRDESPLFELHHSYFSLQGINKSDTIGDVGSRSFYLRKSSSGRSINDGEGSQLIFSSSTEVVPVRASTPLVFLHAFIARKLSKIGRRTRKLWKVLGCMPNG